MNVATPADRRERAECRDIHERHYIRCGRPQPCDHAGMARPLRLHVPGALYHVMSRGNAREAIFRDAVDYVHFLRRLSIASARLDVRCRAYCLMVNHFHLLLEPNQWPVSRMMHQLNSPYSQSFNRRHERVGHVLQGRFKSPMIDGDAYFRRVLRYIVLNPVRAALVAQPADWPWSSYRATAGLLAPPAFLALDRVWTAFDVEVTVAQQRYAAFVAGGPPSPADRLRSTIVDGPEPFRSRVSKMLERHRDDCEVTHGERFACRPSLDRLFENRHDSAALDQAMGEAFERHGYTLKEIGAFVRRPSNTVARRIRHAAGRPVENVEIQI